ncbi:ABC transporter permease [Paenibacillus sp. FSL W8-0186]|uniref:Putative hemin transport system permease protein HrtB n=1 Tax=Paenibacillus woosongensis TaxID=307580 RepID=A0ABQ4MMY4_9BACL|nr:ABC transporter permease [Paenibacillus woosongensis]GIP57341.1 ABC transporter permease [Paenibacillus woosongensis]
MFLALRELKHAKMRYLLIALIMVLIAWLVLFVSGLAQGLSSDNASSIQNMNADYLIVQKDSDHRLTRSTVPEAQLAEIRDFAGGSSAAPLGVQMTAVTKGGETKKLDATLFAIETEGMLAPAIAEGRMVDEIAPDEAVVDISFKEAGIALGEVLEEQMSGQQLKVVGFTKGQSFSHSPVIHVNFKVWGTIKPAVSRGGTGDGLQYNAVALQAGAAKADQISESVPGIEVITMDQALQGIPGYKEEQGSLLMMVAFLFVIAAFVLAVFFYVITIQKMNQFGVLKAIGASSSYLARNIISQVITLSVASLAVSIGLTYGVAAILPAGMPFDLSPRLVVLCSVLFLAVAVVGSLLSLYRVVKVDAIEAIGRAA